MRSGLFLPNFGAFADPTDVADLGARAEAAGWDGLFCWDHVVRHEGDLDVADPWITLAAVATATTRLRLGPLVTPLPRRRPWNVARAAVTLDHLSRGRMVLGVGLGSVRGREFSAFGEETDARARGDLLDEAVGLVQSVWSGQVVDHHGPAWTVDGVRFLPRPHQPGGIPLWAATESLRGRAVRRAAALDGIFPIGITPTDVPTLLEAVAAHRPPGRPPIDVVVTDPGGPEPWIGTGVTWWLAPLAWDRPLTEARAVADRPPPGRPAGG